MARVLNSFNKGLETGYGFADKADKNKASSQKNAYERYIEEHYGPGVTSHRDPLAVARAAAGQVGSAVWGGAKAGAGFLGHAAAGLMGAPQGPSRAVSDGRGGIGSDASITGRNTPSNRQYGDAAVSAGLSSAGSSGSGYGSFNDVGSRISGDLQRDFGLTSNQAAGIVGNLGHESGGFRHYQELNPTSGRGGAGWAQWTGPRRVAFESYVKNNNLHPQSYEANYGFLKNELTGTHAGALAAVKKANTVQDAVYAFEQTFEKANPKYVNYGSRMQYASRLDPSSSSSQIANLQRDLNAKGANIPVDGIMGPLTRTAQQKYSGTTYASTTQDEGRVPTAGRAQAPVQVASVDTGLGTTRGITMRQAPASPYSNTTGGANANAYSAFEAQRAAARSGIPVTPRPVQTAAVDASGAPPLQRGFISPAPAPRTITPRGAPQQTQNQWSQLQGPYTNSTGGANAWSSLQQPYPTRQAPVSYTPFTPAPIQQAPVIAPAVVQTPTARISQPRPDQAVPVPEGGTMLQQLQQQLQRAADIAGQIGSRVGNAVSSGGMGQSFSGARNSGLGYVGGRGYGGGSINQGVGGSINPNR